MGRLRPGAAPLVLRPSERDTLAPAGVCLAFAVLGAFIIVADGSAWGWAALAFFGLGAIVLGATLLPGVSELRLDKEGFAVRSLFRTDRYRWSDVKDFRTVSIPPSGTVRVGFDCSSNARPAAAWLSGSLAGVEACLPDNYGLRPQELANMLTVWRANYIDMPSRLDYEGDIG
jgi:hypothetical protein